MKNKRITYWSATFPAINLYKVSCEIFEDVDRVMVEMMLIIPQKSKDGIALAKPVRDILMVDRDITHYIDELLDDDMEPTKLLWYGPNPEEVYEDRSLLHGPSLIEMWLDISAQYIQYLDGDDIADDIKDYLYFTEEWFNRDIQPQN